jgi:peptidoglycan-binding protein ArfA
VRFDRRAAWLAALVAIAVLATVGWVLSRPHGADDASAPSAAPSTTVSAPAESRPSETNFAPLSIALTDKGFTLGGEMPSQEAKASLSESLRLAFGSGLQVTDRTVVRPGATAPDFAALGSILGAAIGVNGFTFDLKGDTVTLGGTAATADARAEPQAAVTAAWPTMKVVNRIVVR